MCIGTFYNYKVYLFMCVTKQLKYASYSWYNAQILKAANFYKGAF